jgi:lipid-A-disaccharide synthase-like uncharacterized protein
MNIEFFKKRNNFKKKNFSLNPNLYWKLAVFGGLLMALLAFFFGYYLLNQINTEPVSLNTNNEGQAGMVDKVRLEKALNIFSEREKKSTDILNAPSPVVDPSL